MTELNGSSYYRSNPFYQQGGIPDTGFKNRKIPSYLVEIPQGQEYFEPTNKKHFQRVGYYSTIADEHIIDPEPNNSPSRAKHFFRNLNVEDIEGANTNTLISQAVKNRMKAREYLQEKERMKKDEEAREKLRKYEQKQDERKRFEALSKINRQTEPNYHEKVMKLRTEQAEQQSTPTNQESSMPRYQPRPQQQRQPVDYRQQSQAYNDYMREKPSLDQYHERQYQNYRSELDKTERQIRQLENQLKQSRQVGRNKEQSNYHSLAMQEAKNNNQYHQESKQPQRTQQPEERDILPQTYQRQEFNRKGSVPLQEHQQYRQQYSVRQPANYRDNYQRANEIKQKQEISSFKSHSGHLEAPQKIRSITDNRSFHQGYQEKQPPVQRSIESPIYEQRNQSRQTRQQHRRFNPTYLSYGSQAIGLAGRNIVGF